MKKKTLIGLMAWLFDTYILECLTAPIRTQLSASTNPLNILGLLALLGLFIGTVWYHVAGKNKTTWVSPGEYLIGTISSSEGKTRYNPWPISRLVLFLLIGYNLTQTARIFEPGEAAFYGHSSLIILILGSTLQNVLLLGGSALLAMARPLGLITLALAYLFIMGSNYVNARELAELVQSRTTTSALWGLVANLAIGAFYLYRKAQVKDSAGK